VLVSLLTLASAQAQISYPGGTYLQNFNTLPSTGTFTHTGAGPHQLSASPINASGMPGWSFAKSGGSGSNALFKQANGSDNQGAAYSFGPASNTDRALGTLLSGSIESIFGVVLVNDTGATITSFDVAYTGEQWRKSDSATADKLRFEYALGGTSITTGTFTAATALDFTAPAAGGTAAALDGNAAANRVEIAGTISGINWPPGQNLVIRWTDPNISGADSGLAVEDFRLTAGSIPVVPAVASSVPTSGAAAVSISAPISITFNKAVSIAEGGITLTHSSGGQLAAGLIGGPTSFTLTPSASLAYNQTYTLNVAAAAVTDLADSSSHPAADFSFNFTTESSPGAPTPIHAIQGSGAASPMLNDTVDVAGIVTGFYLNSDGTRAGFYVQEPDANADANPDSSEGIYVYANGSSSVSSVLATMAMGDTVNVSGTVREFNTLTELDTLTALSKTGTAELPAAVNVTLPVASPTALEKHEGMRITLPQTLTVTNNFYLGRYGEFDVSSGGVLKQPTNVVEPGSLAIARQAENNLNKLVIDDGTSKENPDAPPYLFGGATTIENTLRTGDTVAGLTGVLTYLSATSYLLEPTQAPVFTRSNPRLTPPTVGGSLKVVGANVLNFFNGNGTGGGFPTSRGADTAAELVRQKKHIVRSLIQLNADIYGLTEMENDGFSSTSAIQELVNELNAAASPGTVFAFSNPGFSPIGTDEITCAFIYKTNTVTLVGNAVANTDAIFNRPPLAQTFRQISTGEKLTVCVNHFKSKGSPPSSGPDVDQGDGQSPWNNRRTLQSTALASWLATSPTGDADPDILIIGDLNAYAKEDPITVLKNVGYVNLTERFEGEGGYSYQFDAQFGHLDHALANSSLAAQITGTANWHNNADEPVTIDYNTEFKSAFNQTLNDADTPWRASDHDPVVVGISLRGFGQWIAGYPAVGSGKGLADDPDRDGIPNVVENFFGTRPDERDAGITALSGSPGACAFRHPIAASIASDVSGSYEWSSNLVDWHASGESEGDVTVTIRAVPVEGGMVEVTANTTAGTTAGLFIRVVAEGPTPP
jgi:predicted extracellular nuclease